MNYISVKHLKTIGACKGQTQKFKETFGSSVKFESLKEAHELALKYAQEFDFNWIGCDVFRKAYQEAEAPLWEAYKEASAPLWEAYQEAKAPLLKAYQEAKAPLRKAYQEAKAPLWEAYQEAEAPLWEAYQEAKAPLWEAYQEAKAPLWEAYQEDCAKVFATMWWELPENTKEFNKEYDYND